VIRAVAFSARKHTNQRRKDVEASPYINHPIALADVLWNEGDIRDAGVIAAESAKLVKLADKICNLRDILASPPTDWAIERKREYFDWAKKVIDQLRGTNTKLERRFDQLYRQRP